MQKSEYARKHTGKRGPTKRTVDAAYQQYRAAWLANHPTATPAEYQRAMADIARRLAI